MSAHEVQAIRKRLSAVNNDWPGDPFTDADKYAEFLESRLIRAVGDREIVFMMATVDGVRGTAEQRRYAATLFTDDAVVRGELTVDKGASYPPPGDVRVVPRTAVRSLTLHHVEFGESSMRPEVVEFTAVFDGLEPVMVGRARYGIEAGGSSSSLFDSLRADLVNSTRVTAARADET